MSRQIPPHDCNDHLTTMGDQLACRIYDIGEIVDEIYEARVCSPGALTGFGDTVRPGDIVEITDIYTDKGKSISGKMRSHDGVTAFKILKYGNLADPYMYVEEHGVEDPSRTSFNYTGTSCDGPFRREFLRLAVPLTDGTLVRQERRVDGSTFAYIEGQEELTENQWQEFCKIISGS
jgi:hypothetical protein